MGNRQLDSSMRVRQPPSEPVEDDAGIAKALKKLVAVRDLFSAAYARNQDIALDDTLNEVVASLDEIKAKVDEHLQGDDAEDLEDENC